MDSKAQKRIEVAKRKARAGESNENISSFTFLDCIFFLCVCGFCYFGGSNYKYFLFLIYFLLSSFFRF